MLATRCGAVLSYSAALLQHFSACSPIAAKRMNRGGVPGIHCWRACARTRIAWIVASRRLTVRSLRAAACRTASKSSIIRALSAPTRYKARKPVSIASKSAATFGSRAAAARNSESVSTSRRKASTSGVIASPFLQKAAPVRLCTKVYRMAFFNETLRSYPHSNSSLRGNVRPKAFSAKWREKQEAGRVRRQLPS